MISKVPRILLFALSCVLLSAVTATALESAPKTYVSDRANVIDPPHEQLLIAMLQELEQKTGARIVVLTVDTADGQDIQEFAFERADQWKFGTKQTSASVLLVVAIKDKKYWTEVGYDWEGVLPDGLVGQIGRERLAPRFKENLYSLGLYETTAVLAQTIAEDRGITLSGMPELRSTRRGVGNIGRLVFLLIMLAVVFGGSRRRGHNRSGLFWGIMLGSMLGGRGGGFGGGGFSSGGFGGFGGGGGGGFGGGGAGGSW